MSGSWEGPEVLKLTDSPHKGSRPYWCHVPLSPGSRNVGAPSERTEVFGLSFKIPSVLLRKCSEMNLIIGRKETHRRDMLPPASRLWSHSEVSSGDRAPCDGRAISVSESRGEAAEQGRISEVRELMIFPDPRLAFGWDLLSVRVAANPTVKQAGAPYSEPPNDNSKSLSEGIFFSSIKGFDVQKGNAGLG